METHVKVLAWIHIVFGAVVVLGGLVALLFFGGLAAMVPTIKEFGYWEAAPAAFLLSLIGTILALLAFILAAPALVGGIGLLYYKKWARILMIIISAINLLNVPIGTILGIYGLWVLLHHETEELFRKRALEASPPLGV